MFSFTKIFDHLYKLGLLSFLKSSYNIKYMFDKKLNRIFELYLMPFDIKSSYNIKYMFYLLIKGRSSRVVWSGSFNDLIVC